MRPVVFVLLLFLAITPTVAQNSTADPDPDSTQQGAGNQTATQNTTTQTQTSGRLGGQFPSNTTQTSTTTTTTTGPGRSTVQTIEDVGVDAWFFITDNVLYGFSEPGESRLRRLGNVFTVYITPINSTFNATVMFDDLPIETTDGQKRVVIEGPTELQYRVSNTRAVNLRILVEDGDAEAFVDYGRLRLRPISAVAKEAEEDDQGDFLEDNLRVFSGSEWTWVQVKIGFATLAAIGLAVLAAWARHREQEANEPVEVFAS